MAWAIITGIFELIAALRLRQAIQGEFWLALAGVVSIILGIVLFLEPAAGMVVIGTIVGIYAILFGILLLALGFWLRGMA